MGISVQNVDKHFGSFHAIDNVSLNIETGSLVALLGPSGSGKSTLLRMIAGLEQPDSGEIFLTGENATYRSVQDRGIGFVFQHYALFKHLTIRQNIAFPLEIRKAKPSQIRHRVEELLSLVQLRGLGDRYPSQLSGGQRQRVALARALAVQPKVLLLDEPFGALDAKVRKELRTWLRKLHNEVHVTTVFVTHDQEEAMEVADQIVVMNEGRIEQVGSAAELYDSPASPFVMSFIGPVNVLPANAGILPRNQGIQGDRVFLRPHDLVIRSYATEDTVPAKIERIVHLGWEVQVELMLPSGRGVTAYLARQDFDKLNLERHQDVHIIPKQVKTFPEYSLN
ncbi:sulfate/molybdate ABC transporter ATP-binding protein [Trichocoleus sp. FACHB-591]|uniref:sulfate/molybdate ABC transporter ATP-binding protein n=1 Tax=Trichocoleus sp. FACHB-591 TaxID=2692872 RepID=UPI001686ACC9|nr:sulfate/molybdate ABC transporter ATP-binding protein [Trichocoleus sp. FACHB-591]